MVVPNEMRDPSLRSGQRFALIMVNFNKLRLPYREDTAFGLLAFAVFVVPLAFSQLTYENFESVKFGLLLLCVGASLALFFFRFKQGRISLAYEKVAGWLLTGFFLTAIISSLLASDKLYAMVGFYYRYTNGLVFLTVFLALIFLLANILDQGRLEYLLKIFVLDALVVAVITFLQSFGWIFYAGADATGIFRGPSLLGNINYSAMFLTAVLPLAIYFFYKEKSVAARWYYGLAALALVFAVIVLASRGAFFAMAAEAVIFLIFSGRELFKFFKNRFKFWIVGGLLAVILVGGVILHISRPQALSSIFFRIDANTTDRLAAWEVSLIGIKQHPWFGSGLGNYALFFEKSRPVNLVYQLGVFDDAHNLFLFLAVTGGLPMTILFFSWLTWAAMMARRQFIFGNKPFYLALLCGLSAFVASGCFNPVPIPMYLLLAILVVGMLLPSLKRREINFFPISLKILGGGFGILIFLVGLVSLTSEHLLGFSARFYANQNFQQSLRLSNWAYKINPTNNLFLAYHAGSAINLKLSDAVANPDIKKIVFMHPDQADSYVRAAALYNLRYFVDKNTEDLLLAIKYQELSLKLDPWFAARFGQLALDYYKLGNMAAAKEYALRDISLDRNDFSAWILLTQLYQQEGNRAGMIEGLTHAYDLQPDIPQIKYLLYLTKQAPDIKTVPLQIEERKQGL